MGIIVRGIIMRHVIFDEVIYRYEKLFAFSRDWKRVLHFTKDLCSIVEDSVLGIYKFRSLEV